MLLHISGVNQKVQHINNNKTADQTRPKQDSHLSL